MKLLFLFLIFLSICFPDQVDEMEELILNHPDLIMHPEKLYKDGGLWLADNSNEPFTGRVEIYSNQNKQDKVLECTIVNGYKHGIFIQYINQINKTPGIIGLYMNDKKEGGWTTIEPLDGWVNSPILLSTLPMQTIYIGYRDGVRDGSVRISDLLSGQYYNGQKTGAWYFFNDSDNKTLWTVKHQYEQDILIDSECREHLNGTSFEMNCDEYEMKYVGSKYVLRQLDPIIENDFVDQFNKLIINDVNGLEVEIMVEDFLNHISYYHKRKVSIHKERGYSFHINDSLRTLLRNKSRDQFLED